MTSVEAHDDGPEGCQIIEAYQGARLRWQNERRHTIADARRIVPNLSGIKARHEIVVGLGKWKIQLAKLGGVGR